VDKGHSPVKPGTIIRLSAMKKINTNEMEASDYSSPKGKFAQRYKGVSIALGRQEKSMDLRERHPFDVEIEVIPPGKINSPYHSHSAQWEFYHIISGKGKVRHKDGMTDIGAGDAFIFPPDEPHQIINDSTEDLTMYVIADNPVGESCYYPDSGKWLVKSPESKLIRSEAVDYYDGEE
jgi:uncharacterized cupin superfamily protein